MDEAEREALRALILERRAAAQAAAEAGRDGTATVELDQQSVGRLSRMDALQGQAMARATAARHRTEIARLDAALARLEIDPEFGFCAECGDPIQPQRLRIDPAAERCAACAARA